LTKPTAAELVLRSSRSRFLVGTSHSRLSHLDHLTEDRIGLDGICGAGVTITYVGMKKVGAECGGIEKALSDFVQASNPTATERLANIPGAPTMT
jgi:hypothetical protein